MSYLGHRNWVFVPMNQPLAMGFPGCEFPGTSGPLNGGHSNSSSRTMLWRSQVWGFGSIPHRSSGVYRSGKRDARGSRAHCSGGQSQLSVAERGEGGMKERRQGQGKEWVPVRRWTDEVVFHPGQDRGGETKQPPAPLVFFCHWP